MRALLCKLRKDVIDMSKSQKTYELEEIISMATARPNRVGCPEVTLDDYGIVDFVSMDIDGARTVRCYELKISKSDFLSDAKKTFIGDFNYYVIPTELWMSVKGHVEPGVGVWTVDSNGHVSVKKQAKRMKCQMSRSRIMTKILKALNRENLKHCENSWRHRQMQKKVSDTVGGAISVGDSIEYRGEMYDVIEIEYERDQMAMTPTLVIVPSGKTEPIQKAKPSIVKKVNANNILCAQA